MSKLFKVCAVLVSAVFALSGTAMAETVDDFWTLDIGASIAAVADVTVTVRNLDGTIPDPVAMVFSGAAAAALPPGGSPWVICDQYLQVVYTSNYGSWGVRIVSDNVPYLNAQDGGWDVQFADDAAAHYFAGQPMDLDPDVAGYESLGYAGLLRTDVDNWPNPSYRAALGWQVLVDPAGLAGPAVPTCAVADAGAGEELVDSNIGGYGEPWAWLQDKTLYLAADPGGVNQFDGRIYLGETGGGEAIYNDNLIVFGSGASGGVTGAHPAAADADGDIAVYLAARYGNTDWNDPADPFVFMLGAGDYGTRLLVELVHE